RKQPVLDQLPVELRTPMGHDDLATVHALVDGALVPGRLVGMGQHHVVNATDPYDFIDEIPQLDCVSLLIATVAVVGEVGILIAFHRHGVASLLGVNVTVNRSSSWTDEPNRDLSDCPKLSGSSSAEDSSRG